MSTPFPFRQFTILAKIGATVTMGNDSKINVTSPRILAAYVKKSLNYVVILDNIDTVGVIQVVEDVTKLSWLKPFVVLAEISPVKISQGLGSTIYVNPDVVFSVVNFTNKTNAAILGQITLVGPSSLKVFLQVSVTGTAAITSLSS